MRVGFIYRLYCLDADVKECYIGSCWKIKVRMRVHKSDCNNINRVNYNFKVYTFIRANGGWSNWDYEYFVVNVIDKTHLQMKEQKRMDLEMNPILNDRRAYTDRVAYVKQQYINNKEYRKTYAKQRYIDNKESINLKQKKKYNCECGGKYQHQSKSIHFKTLRHRCYQIILHA